MENIYSIKKVYIDAIMALNSLNHSGIADIGKLFQVLYYDIRIKRVFTRII